MKTNKLLLMIIPMACIMNSPVFAKVSSEQAKQLETRLTPMGAERSANRDGSIPTWGGGITTVPTGYKTGDFHPDPFSQDPIKYTITKANIKTYKDLLTPGQLKLFSTYPNSFKMNVYQTRRSASYPEYIYQATKTNATRAGLMYNGAGITGAVKSVPFPIPASGLEVIWNHLLRYRGQSVTRQNHQAALTASGDYTLVETEEKFIMSYANQQAAPDSVQTSNIMYKYKQKITAPARLTGTALLIHETLDHVKTPRQAWTYNTGQRHARREPNTTYDAPSTASDGLKTEDDNDMYNGSPDRYTWTLKGKQELLIPYNDYKLHSGQTKITDILKPGHINPDLVRYEKHRVWVVEANLKADQRHTYKKRVFYIDEDSWQIAVTDIYDNRNELYRIGVAHPINYYELPAPSSTLEVFHDLQSRRYIASGLDNEAKPHDYSVVHKDKNFTSSALRRAGRR
ncbi:MAG: outer membrane lipoprotein-sorting protein [Robiginitomaculum sp.]|nr:MAG: outer membrane lipoprotein-sorting protein [Robiginitomaculum sp.]